MTGFNIAAILTLDSKAFNAGLAKARGTAKGFATTTKNVLGGVTKAVGVMGAATAAFAALSVKTGAEFDKSMSQVAATLGKTNAEMRNEVGETDTQFGHFSGTLRDFAKFMGKNTAFSAKQSADALNYMALAGYDAQKSMNMLPNVLNLAAAGSMDLANASDMVTDASSALGLTTKETTKLVDQMARASSRSNTSVEQLGSAILTVGGTAKIMRGRTTELSAALGILADNGIKGAEGGTALRNVLNGLNSKKFEKNFGSMGVSAFDADGKMRNLKDTLADMGKAMEGMTDQEKAKLIQSTFNVRDLKSVNALLATTGQRWDELTGAIEDSEGAAGQMAETQLDNLAGDVTILKSAFEGLQISISDKLSPSFRKFVQGATGGISALTDILEGKGVNSISSFGAAIAKSIASGIPDAIKQIPNMLKGLAYASIDLSNVIGGDFTSGLLTKIGDAVESILPKVQYYGGVIIQNLIGSFTALMGRFAEVAIPMMESLASGLQKGVPILLANIMPMIANLSQGLRSNAGKLVDAGIALMLSLAKGLANSLPTLITYVPTIVTNIAGIINDNAPKILAAGVQLIIILGQGLIQALPTLVANIPQIIAAIVNAFLAFGWVGLGKSIIKNIGKGLKAAGSFIKATMKRVGKAAWNGFKYELKASVKGGASIMKALGNALKSGGQAAVKAVTRQFKKVTKPITEPFKKAYDTLKGIVQKIKDFFPIKIGNLIGGIKKPSIPSIGVTWKNAKKGIFSISYPSIHWNAKAMENPYMFNGATIFGAGEAGDEILYGRQNLLNDIAEATSASGQTVEITNYITVDGAEDPEDFADRFARQLKMDMRTT